MYVFRIFRIRIRNCILLTNCLSKYTTKTITFGRIKDFSLLRIVSQVIFARQLFTILHLVVAGLLIIAKHRAILLLVVESIYGLPQRVRKSKAFGSPLGTMLVALAIALLYTIFIF